MCLGEPERPTPQPVLNETLLPPLRVRRTADDFRPVEFFRRPPPMLKRDDQVQLRCVEVDPRHLTLVELEAADCHFPYGGDRDGEAITFCGHPRRRGSSYCTPHFHLTRDPEVTGVRALSCAPLRLVEAV